MVFLLPGILDSYDELPLVELRQHASRFHRRESITEAWPGKNTPAALL
jgi:hypothetical protein